MNNSLNSKTVDCAEMNTNSFSNAEKMRLSIYEGVMKRLFFICEICEGALIPTSTCVSCKKTISRKCRDCGAEISMSHAACKSELRRNCDLTEVKLQ